MTCPNGHQSATEDYCSICGAVMSPPVSGGGLRTCPVCGIPAAATALFCESCGYDYLTGVRPRDPRAPIGAAPPGNPVPPPARSGGAVGSMSAVPGSGPVAPGPTFPTTPTGGASATPAGPPPVPAQRRVPTAARSQVSVQTGPATWVAEIWIDPEWHAAQGGPDQLPSPGQPVIVGLRKPTVVIGRSSASGTPDIDLVTDSGVSRRQASLVTDGRRWFVEDLGSANGTYVGRADIPVPQTPISGRVEVSHHDRILVGSWTRIVVRPALRQEANF